MNKQTYNFLTIFINILVFLGGFLFIFIYLHYDICTDHDHFHVFGGSFFDFFTETRIFSTVLTAIFYKYIPNFFNVHMNNISNTLNPFICASLITMSAIFSLKIFYLFSNSKLLFKKSFSILYPAVFIIAAVLPPIEGELKVFKFHSIASTLRHFDHYGSFVFLVIFIYGIISSFFYKKKSFCYILYLLNGIILGLTNEYLPIIGTVFSFVVFLFSCAFYNKLKIEKHFIIFSLFSFLSVISTSLIQYLLSSFSWGYIGKHPNLKIFDFHNNIFTFLQDFTNIAFSENIIYIIIIICLLILIYLLKNKENTLKIYFFTFSILISYTFLFFTMFFIGNSELIYDFSSWIYYYPLRTIYTKSLILIILLLFGYFIYTKNKQNINIPQKIFIYSKIILIIFLYSEVFFYTKYITNEFTYNLNNSKVLRKAIYQADKMSLLYYDLDGFAILPISFYENYTNSFLFRPICTDSYDEMREKRDLIRKNEIKNNISRLFIWTFEYSEASIDYLYYFQNAYGKKLKGVIFVDDNIAFQEFYKRNGSFSDKELKNTNFTYLKRLNYNLNIDKELILYPNASFLWAAKCTQNIDIENFNDAISYCSNAINLNNNEKNKIIHYYYLRAKAFEGNKDYKQSAKDFSKFIELSPYSIDVRNELAYVYLLNKQYEKALKTYKNIIEIFPFYSSFADRLTFYTKLAKLHYYIGNYKKALDNINIEFKYPHSNFDNIYLKKLKERIETKNEQKFIQ